MLGKLYLTALLCFLSTAVYAQNSDDFYTENEKKELNQILEDDYISSKKEEMLVNMAKSRIDKIKEISVKEMKDSDKLKLNQISWPDESLWLQYQSEQILNEERESKND